MKIQAAALVISLVVAGCTTASQKADNDYWAKDYKSAYAEFLPLAQGGDWLADERIGYMYAHGLGVTQDMTQAQHWYEKAALDGDVSVENSLGADALYASPSGPNYPVAAKWFQMAADNGNPDAQLEISALYEQGLGVPRDHDTALHYLNLYVAKTNVVGQSTYHKFMFSGGDNTGGFLQAVQHLVQEEMFRTSAMKGYGLGVVVLSFHEQDGRAQDVRVDRSSGNSAADAAVVNLLQSLNLPPVLASLSHVDRFQLPFGFQEPGEVRLYGSAVAPPPTP